MFLITGRTQKAQRSKYSVYTVDRMPHTGAGGGEESEPDCNIKFFDSCVTGAKINSSGCEAHCGRLFGWHDKALPPLTTAIKAKKEDQSGANEFFVSSMV